MTTNVSSDLELRALAALEATVMIAARALCAAYPAINKVARPEDSAAITAARTLVDDCERLLFTLDDYRVHVVSRLSPSILDDSHNRPF
jgi:hypothetical protein